MATRPNCECVGICVHAPALPASAMYLYRFEYKDGRQVVFSAFDAQVAWGWAREQATKHGLIVSWNRQTEGEAARPTAPRWSEPGALAPWFLFGTPDA